MSMKTTAAMSIAHWVVVFAGWAVACADTSAGIDATGKDDTDDAQLAHDREACRDAADELRDRGCPLGLLPRAEIGGEPVAATRIDDAGIPICGGLGRWIEAGDVAEAEWVGTEIFQNPQCTIGCFVPECGRPSDVCVAGLASGGLCAADCRDGADAQGCRSLVLKCNGLEPEEVDPDDEACGLGADEDEGG